MKQGMGTDSRLPKDLDRSIPSNRQPLASEPLATA
jgi:hypothetical protein